MSGWFDARAEQSAKLSPQQRDAIARINRALRRSDRAIEDHFFSLSTFTRTAQKAGSSGRITGPWLDTMDKLHHEVLAARDRLDALGTGLKAEKLLRKALTHAAAGVAAWRTGMGSDDPDEIARATERMHDQYAAARRDGKLGLAYLERGV